MQDEMKHYLDLGYSCVKMKIGGVPLKDDIKRIEAALKVVGGKGENLCVDVNGRYDLDEALACGDAIAPYNLRWYEEPLDPLDYLLHAALATRYRPPLATGENLFSMQDARNLIRHGGLRSDRDWLQFDPALSYGLVEYLRTLDMLSAHGWSRRRCVPHGGHQFALNIAWVSVLAATSRIRRFLRRSAALPTTLRSRTAGSQCRTFPASVSRRRTICIR